MSLLADAEWRYSSILWAVVPLFEEACELRLSGWLGTNSRGTLKGQYAFLQQSVNTYESHEGTFCLVVQSCKGRGVHESTTDVTETKPLGTW